MNRFYIIPHCKIGHADGHIYSLRTRNDIEERLLYGFPDETTAIIIEDDGDHDLYIRAFITNGRLYDDDDAMIMELKCVKISSPAFILRTHVLAYLRRTRRRARVLAVFMAMHHRLGVKSKLGVLDGDCLGSIMNYLDQ